MRYVVLDTWASRGAADVAGHRGKPIGEFNTEKIAKTMALQRLARGHRGVVVLDTETGLIVFPFGGARCEQLSPGVSGTRRIVPGEELDAAGEASGKRNR